MPNALYRRLLKLELLVIIILLLAILVVSVLNDRRRHRLHERMQAPVHSHIIKPAQAGYHLESASTAETLPQPPGGNYRDCM